MDKAGELAVALVIYAMRCIEDGETEALASMGFGPSEVTALASLTFGDLKRIERLRRHCLDIKVDRQAFRAIIQRARADGLSTEWEHALIRADASFEMMRRLFGTSRRAYTNLRQVFGVSSVGRPREPTGDEASRLWRAIQHRLRESGRHPLAPADYLAISRKCAVPLRTVWRESKRIGPASA
ncbi:MAG: STY4526/YPO1902 family pathogenicity island replication protein [Gammaproteobacteria bacterium]|nr:STY4526/YPO1902 family pathogenicity island replication protein [Gammaproteobacteria bacterium]